MCAALNGYLKEEMLGQGENMYKCNICINLRQYWLFWKTGGLDNNATTRASTDFKAAPTLEEALRQRQLFKTKKINKWVTNKFIKSILQPQGFYVPHIFLFTWAGDSANWNCG